MLDDDKLRFPMHTEAEQRFDMKWNRLPGKNVFIVNLNISAYFVA